MFYGLNSIHRQGIIHHNWDSISGKRPSPRNEGPMSKGNPAVGPDRSGGKDMLSVNKSRPRGRERLLASLLESASQAIISIDRTGRIVLANRRTEEMFGYKPESLIGNHVELLLP